MQEKPNLKKHTAKHLNLNKTKTRQQKKLNVDRKTT